MVKPKVAIENLVPSWLIKNIGEIDGALINKNKCHRDT
jgi:hypothetical protein